MVTGNAPTVHDPYGGCEAGCTYDLVRGVLLADLNHDGPYPDTPLLLGAGWLAARIAEVVSQQATDSRIRT